MVLAAGSQHGLSTGVLAFVLGLILLVLGVATWYAARKPDSRVGKGLRLQNNWNGATPGPRGIRYTGTKGFRTAALLLVLLGAGLVGISPFV